jgi:hypothetical protein
MRQAGYGRERSRKPSVHARIWRSLSNRHFGWACLFLFPAAGEPSIAIASPAQTTATIPTGDRRAPGRWRTGNAEHAQQVREWPDKWENIVASSWVSSVLLKAREAGELSGSTPGRWLSERCHMHAPSGEAARRSLGRRKASTVAIVGPVARSRVHSVSCVPSMRDVPGCGASRECGLDGMAFHRARDPLYTPMDIMQVPPGV